MTVPIDNLTIENLMITSAIRYGYASTNITGSGTLSLIASSPAVQFLIGGASGYIVKLPDATTIAPAQHYMISNTTSFTVDVQDGAGNHLLTLSQNSIGYLYLRADTTIAGVWVYWQVLASSTASGIINYNISSATPFSTSSSTDVLITGFSVTPQAGTYGIWYNSDGSVTQNNALVGHTVYRAGAAITDSIRRTQSVSSNFVFQQTTETIASFDGSQACDVRVKTNQGTLTVNGRSLLLIRLGP